MDDNTTNPPVAKRLPLPLQPEQAFALFTAGLQRWWPLRSHSCTGEVAARLTLEPRLGGEVVEQGADGQRHVWGTITEWSPPLAFAMTWHPAQPAAQATRLRVSFQAIAGGCELQLLHDGWAVRGDDAAAARDSYDQGWPVVLAAYEHLARQPEEKPR